MGFGAARRVAAAHNQPEVEAAFDAVPAGVVAEILEGELHTQPRPRVRHARAALGLGRGLGPYDGNDRRAGEPGGWFFLIEPELHLGARPDRVVPDLAGWLRTRMPELPDEAAISLAPDWACEILSDRTEGTDRTKKMRIYRCEGVGHVWLLSPTLMTLEVYRLDDARWLLLDTFERGDRVHAEPFEAVELDLPALST